MGAASITHLGPPRPLKVKTAVKVRRVSARHRRDVRVIRGHDERTPIDQADIDPARIRHYADEPTNGLEKGEVHFDHGPSGLGDDVTTMGFVHKF